MSTNVDLGFPLRLYTLGREPKLVRSINYHSKIKFLKNVKIAVGDDVWDYICSSSFGVIAKFVENDFSWSSKIVERLLEKQLVCEKKYEIWCLFGSTPVRFSLSEFENITALNCAPLPEEIEMGKDVHKELWKKMGVDENENPSKFDLINVVKEKDVATWSKEDKIRFAYLSILATIIICGDYKTKLSEEEARMVFDLPKFEGYPWGRLAFKTLIESVKKSVLEKESITIHGFVQVLQIWMYNLFPSLGVKMGNLSGIESPTLLKFNGKKWYGKGDIDIDKFLADDEENIENAIINVSEPTFWKDERNDENIDALMQAICKEGGLGGVTWVEQGLKSFDKKNNREKEEGRGDGGEKKKKKKKKAATYEELRLRNEKLEKKVSSYKIKIESYRALCSKILKIMDGDEQDKESNETPYEPHAD